MTRDLMFSPGVIEYEQGWRDGRAQLMRELAERVDNIEATWQTVPRPTWEQKVADRIARMEAEALAFPARGLEHQRRARERDRQVLGALQRRVFTINGCPVPSQQTEARVDRPTLRLVPEASERGTVA